MSEKALTEAVERLEGEVERRRECDCGSSAPHVPTPGGCTPPAPVTTAAMLGEAIGFARRVEDLCRSAGEERLAQDAGVLCWEIRDAMKAREGKE